MRSGNYPSFQEAVEKVSRWPLAYAIVALSSSALVQAVLAPRLSIEGLLLGTTRLSSSPLIAAMALWTFGVMAIASLMITLLAFWSKRVFQVSRFVRQQLYARHAHRALRNSDTSSKTYTIIASTVIVTLLVRFCIPRQMAFVILFLIQWTKMLLADEKVGCHVGFG